MVNQELVKNSQVQLGRLGLQGAARAETRGSYSKYQGGAGVAAAAGGQGELLRLSVGAMRARANHARPPLKQLPQNPQEITIRAYSPFRNTNDQEES